MLARLRRAYRSVALPALVVLSTLTLGASAGVSSAPDGAAGAETASRTVGGASASALVGASVGALVDARPGNGSSAGPATPYQLPMAGPLRVVRPFAAPATRYSAGHRGVDLASAPGGQVRAAGPGTVRFAGNVAGRGVVVIDHPGGVSTEYEPLATGAAVAAIGAATGSAASSGGSRVGRGIAVHAGQQVAGGAALGVVSGAHGACAPSGCLHWGARRAGDYFDPLTLLQPLGPLRLAPTTEP
jgi:murein DD-endopeptidase MepM/ murein hydrolase activator NlpD